MSTDQSEYLAAHVQEALARDPRVNEPELAVSVVKGRVLVRGLVPTVERRDAIVEVVHGVAPDLEVDNQTTVAHFPDSEGVEHVR